MSVNLIVILIFIAVLLIMSLFYRKATLDKLPMPGGETVLYEERGVKVEQGGAPRTALFFNCIVRVTDRRIIIAQKMLLSKNSYALRHVITYYGAGESTDLGATFKKGYLNFSIYRDDIKLEEEGETFVRIDIPKTPLTGNQYVRFATTRPDSYREL
ncbi:MAG TPA: hypothetical protein PK358_14705 [Spirochaetota bacterium]|nr:hypothetical protein [Spirochaetota bacterium]HPJ36087.1 hypothetical protein [Spirochaetota bacterium]